MNANLPPFLLALTLSLSSATVFAGGFISGFAAAGEGVQRAEEAAARQRAMQLQNELLELQVRQQQRREAEEIQRRSEQQVARQNAEQFWRAVAQLVPDVVAVSKDPRFNQWLDSTDPLTDITRRTYWIDSINHGQVNQVAAIIDEWRYLPIVPPAPSKIVASSDVAFVSELTRLQPKWPQINNDPNFKAWLLSFDPKTAITRQIYLNDAQGARDVSRVERIFAAYLLMLPTTPPYLLQDQQRPAVQRAIPKGNRLPM